MSCNISQSTPSAIILITFLLLCSPLHLSQIYDAASISGPPVVIPQGLGSPQNVSRVSASLPIHALVRHLDHASKTFVAAYTLRAGDASFLPLNKGTQFSSAVIMNMLKQCNMQALIGTIVGKPLGATTFKLVDADGDIFVEDKD
eukprot:1136818-Pelagomonas_calceolata.AAC.2